MARINTPELANKFIDEQIAAVRKQVGSKKVLLALSGGVDSSVVAALLIKAFNFKIIFIVGHIMLPFYDRARYKNLLLAIIF